MIGSVLFSFRPFLQMREGGGVDSSNSILGPFLVTIFGEVGEGVLEEKLKKYPEKKSWLPFFLDGYIYNISSCYNTLDPYIDSIFLSTSYGLSFIQPQS